MELNKLIEALSDPSAYPNRPAKVEVKQTHISAVFLAGDLAYKIKKPYNLQFLDFTTLEKRRRFCEEEVRLNRRLAPDVYLGAVPVTRDGENIRVEGSGTSVEWAVKMRRLPDEATLKALLERDEVGGGLIESLAKRLAGFHADARRGPRISECGCFEVVAKNARENFEQARPHLGLTISQRVFDRLRQVTERVLTELRPLIDGRAERNIPCDTHGDLHLDHVYVFPERPEPENLIAVDCIEFNERFRFADPVADMAFLVMDFAWHGRRDLAALFAKNYFLETGDAEGQRLLPFYTAYRAAVRGKVDGFQAAEKETPEAIRRRALQSSRGHWLLALDELEAPATRPCLVLAGGLPGVGKSTLASMLVEQAGFALVRSDLARKELAGVPRNESAAAPFGEGIYSPEWTKRTYDECLQRAERLLFEGGRVLMDASFGEEQKRRLFLDAAKRWGVRTLFLHCQASPETVKKRLSKRDDGPSDADWNIYRQSAERWEKPGESGTRHWVDISTEGKPEESLGQALAALSGIGLW